MSVDKCIVIALSPLSRRRQLSLNARAVWRDVVAGDYTKLGFHLRGLGRALLAR